MKDKNVFLKESYGIGILVPKSLFYNFFSRMNMEEEKNEDTSYGVNMKSLNGKYIVWNKYKILMFFTRPLAIGSHPK